MASCLFIFMSVAFVIMTAGSPEAIVYAEATSVVEEVCFPLSIVVVSGLGDCLSSLRKKGGRKARTYGVYLSTRVPTL